MCLDLSGYWPLGSLLRAACSPRFQLKAGWPDRLGEPMRSRFATFQIMVMIAAGVAFPSRADPSNARSMAFGETVYVWLRGAVWVERTKGGLAIHDCANPHRIGRELARAPAGAERLAARMEEMGGWLLYALSPLRKQFQEALAGNPEAVHWSNEELSHRFRGWIVNALLAGDDSLDSFLPDIRRAVIDAGFSPAADFGSGPTAQGSPPGCGKMPCCDPACDGRGCCSVSRCDGAPCPSDLTCQCLSYQQEQETCGSPGAPCSVETPRQVGMFAGPEFFGF